MLRYNYDDDLLEECEIICDFFSYLQSFFM